MGYRIVPVGNRHGRKVVKTAGSFGWRSALIGAFLCAWSVELCTGLINCPTVMRSIFFASEGGTRLQLLMEASA